MEVILFLSGTINFTTKDWLQPVWTSFFHVVDCLVPIFKGPVVVPKYLDRSRLVAVASCLSLVKKKLGLTGLKNTSALVVVVVILVLWPWSLSCFASNVALPCCCCVSSVYGVGCELLSTVMSGC